MMTRLDFVLLFVVSYIFLASGSCVPGTKSAVASPAEPIPDDSKRIVGGTETNIDKYPYQASIRLDSSVLIHICGGSIYAPRIIITAAHCLKGRYASYIRVVVGSSTIADQTQQGIAAAKLIYHSGYVKLTHANDIGLVILAESLVWSELVQPIPLARVYPAPGTKAVVTGWGKTDEDAETLANQLQEASVQIVDINSCYANYLTRNYTITEQMVCAGLPTGGRDACQGDSGGPLAVNGRLVGVVSWGIGCARSEFPGVYTSIPYHAPWIEQQAQLYL